MKLTGIVLAGGKSIRMGTDKGLLDFNGKKLVEYPIHLLQQYCDQIIISANNPAYSNFGVERVEDEYPDCGPAGGLATALKHSTNEWNLVLGCDMPFVNNALIDFLIENTGNSMCLVPVFQNHVEPLVALYHIRMQKIIENAIHDKNLTLRYIFNEVATYINVDALLFENPRLFDNFNSKYDFK